MPLQNNMKYDVISRNDPKRVVHARRCPDIEWGSSIVLGNTVDRSYKSNIVTLLCPLAAKQSDPQVGPGLALRSCFLLLICL